MEHLGMQAQMHVASNTSHLMSMALQKKGDLADRSQTERAANSQLPAWPATEEEEEEFYKLLHMLTKWLVKHRCSAID